MRVLSVVGNRPQFVKSAALSVALRGRGIDEVLLHTGQHYDPELSAVFFEELGLPEPDVRLDLHTAEVAAMTPAILDAVRGARPDAVLVYGDTNSTLAGARAAVEAGVPVAHVEAGLRSGDLEMPEERNRIEVDRMANVLFAPDERSRETLAAEGVEGRVEVVGDVMADATMQFAPIARRRSRLLSELELTPGRYVVATVHREANTRPERLARIVGGLNGLTEPVVFPVHPRTSAALERDGLTLHDNVLQLPARLSRLRGARRSGARDRHGLRRPPEGGVLVRRAVRHPQGEHGMGGHGFRWRKPARGRRSSRPGLGCRRRADAAGAAAAVRRR